MALIKCLECGKEILNKAETCPHCGCPISKTIGVVSSPSESAVNNKTTENKPQNKLKKWIVFFVIVLASAIVAIVIFFIPSKYKWDNVTLKQILPEPSSKYGVLYINCADDLYLSVKEISFSEYEEYLSGCIDKGFIYVVNSSTSSYTAFNSDGYELKLDYYEYDKVMNISLDVRVSGTIKWSNSMLASLLPVPEVNVGSIVNDNNYRYELYIGNTSKTKYDVYVLECEEKGFDINAIKADTTFYAENEFGYKLVVDYYACDLVYICLEEMEDEDGSNEGETNNEHTSSQETTTLPPSSTESTSSNINSETVEDEDYGFVAQGETSLMNFLNNASNNGYEIVDPQRDGVYINAKAKKGNIVFDIQYMVEDQKVYMVEIKMNTSDKTSSEYKKCIAAMAKSLNADIEINVLNSAIEQVLNNPNNRVIKSDTLFLFNDSKGVFTITH